MPEASVRVSRQKQSSASKRATFERLKLKPRLSREVILKMPNEDNALEEVTLLFKSIGSLDYDKLLTKNPPNTEQKAEGNSYNIHTFAPALLSKVCTEPEMSEEDWSEIWNSPDWNRGEVMQLFMSAVEICNQGMEVPPTEAV
jgi:hypothetical protein